MSTESLNACIAHLDGARQALRLNGNKAEALNRIAKAKLVLAQHEVEQPVPAWSEEGFKAANADMAYQIRSYFIPITLGEFDGEPFIIAIQGGLPHIIA